MKNSCKLLHLNRIQIGIILFVTLSSSNISAQETTIPKIPTEWPLNMQNSMSSKRLILIEHSKIYDAKVDDFNARCGLVKENDYQKLSACRKKSGILDAESDLLDKEVEIFLATFNDNERIYKAYKEQKEFKESEQVKIDQIITEQKHLIQQRLKEPNRWSNGVINSLKTNEPPLPYKRFNELESGDVILFSPSQESSITDKITGKAIIKADQIASGSNVSSASHTVTYLKEENGKKLFLDNIPGQGPKIISEDELLKSYGDRDTQVAKLNTYGIAQPLNKEEAIKLYETAKEMEVKNKADKVNKAGNLVDTTNYGAIGKDNIVCSEASWILLKSTGREMPKSKSQEAKTLGVDFSPSDFYENVQYFLVTPLSINSEKKMY
ncbi:MAG: hypothetical protein Q8S44_05145 [Flavobacteriaceae bacterium]|nr:hypothetical protein [Flavobacteriaceae bacterium]